MIYVPELLKLFNLTLYILFFSFELSRGMRTSCETLSKYLEDSTEVQTKELVSSVEMDEVFLTVYFKLLVRTVQ